jgi:hypothetical protein
MKSVPQIVQQDLHLTLRKSQQSNAKIVLNFCENLGWDWLPSSTLYLIIRDATICRISIQMETQEKFKKIKKKTIPKNAILEVEDRKQY